MVLLACEAAGFAPRLVHSSDDFRAVVALAGAGAGRGAGAALGARGMDLTGVWSAPSTGRPRPTRRVFAAVRRGAEEHPLIRPVLDALAEAAPEA